MVASQADVMQPVRDGFVPAAVGLWGRCQVQLKAGMTSFYILLAVNSAMSTPRSLCPGAIVEYLKLPSSLCNSTHPACLHDCVAKSACRCG